MKLFLLPRGLIPVKKESKSEKGKLLLILILYPEMDLYSNSGNYIEFINRHI